MTRRPGRRTAAIALVLAISLPATGALHAQTAAPAPTVDSWRKEAALQWRALHDKLLVMARDTI